MSNTSGLHFGLNIKKKGPALVKPRTVSSRPLGGRNAFGSHSSDEDNLDSDEDDKTASKSRPSPFNSSSSSASATAAVNKTLRPYAASTLQSNAVLEQQSAALAQDASVFDYDGVYDQLKAGDRAKELARKQDSADRKPKYVNALLQAAETRKRDRQIAEERKIEREREQEGEQFKDKEMFITPAYKAQKEAMRKAEEEDRKREEMLAKDKDGSLMQGFYKNLLDQRTQLRTGSEGDVASSRKVSAVELEALEQEKRNKEREEREIAEQARERGLKVSVNDEGQVVDKRELLKGGLNIVKKPTTESTSSSSSRSGRDRRSSDYDRDRAYRDYKDSKSSSRHGNDRYEDRGDQRSRTTEMIERQLLAQEEKRKEEEKQREDSIRESLKRKNEDNQVMDAKARYLARKAAAAGGGSKE
ncbi:hypothetical protein BG006_004988 [Podila minutissima]|uniref:Nuclear speckle splicing regulatory protein 1 N-terminal domain-containing protein n=1 Tax=Podila minutissima TaxID=64525 RepID=A0A9P5VMC3_9FUNG|nr:hypothetical protein BG006_004988 [Podila minutissima]